MRIASYLIIGLTISSIGGLMVSTSVNYRHNQLRELEQNAGQYSITKAWVHRFRDASGHMLVTADLVIGSEISYLVPGARKQVQGLHEALTELRKFPLLQRERETMDLIDSFIAEIGHIVDSGSKPLDQSSLIQYDKTAAKLHNLILQLDEDVEYQVVIASEAVRTETVSREIFDLGFYVGYTILMILLLGALLHQIARPVRKLTIDAEDAIALGHLFRPVDRGPMELRLLSGTISRFIGQLEERVAERTEELRQQTDELAAEIEIRKITEQELKIAKVTAEQASRAKTEFLSVMSHELRTPMHAILGTLTLLRDTKLIDEQRVLAETAEESSAVLMSLLNNVLDMSKIEAGHLDVETSTFSLIDTVDQVLSLFHPQFCEKGILLAGILSPDVPHSTVGDSVRTRQVLNNLIGNACKFTQTGHVHLRIEEAIEAPQSEQQNFIRFVVSDTGEGIAAKAQTNVFNEFVQVDKSNARRSGGAGLGLSISRRLVELMGGSIGIVSAQGIGSEFWFELPISPSGQSNERVGVDDVDRQEHIALKQRLGERQIVVVGDDLDLAQTLTRMLQGWVASVRVISDADSLQLMTQQVAINTTIVVCCLPEAPVWSNFLLGSLQESKNTILMAITPYTRDSKKATNENNRFDMQFSYALKPLPFLKAVCGVNSHVRRVPVENGNCNSTGLVLLVEDSEANRLFATIVLEKAGYTVEAAENGVEALQKVKLVSPNVILMDLQMPVMDGYEATVAIRNLAEPTAKIPIIAFTADVMAEREALSRGIKMDAFLSKPLAKSSLLETVSYWVGVNRRLESDEETFIKQ
jgi:signal transduction histidine kinase/CheY-like chemotaxis protein